MFLSVYDDIDERRVAELYAPYEPHLASVTTLAVNASEQLTAAANALTAFLQHCEAHSDQYDAVVLTRFDLYFKQSFPRLLGADLTELHGIRFLWRELEAGSGWRQLWNATEAELARMTPQSQTDALRYASRKAKSRVGIFVPRSWRASIRTADTFHAFGFRYTRCFRSAVLYEMTRNWKPFVSSTSSAAGAAPATSAIVFKKGDPARTDAPPHLVSNHWIHKVRYSVQRALPPSHMKFLIEDGAFDSNPCQGDCQLNPVYDILPRASWVVRSNICQDPERDFQYDNTTGTLCCPSPDYCCPNSVSDCTSHRAILFNASRVPTSEIASGWRRHYMSRVPVRFDLHQTGREAVGHVSPKQFAQENLSYSVCPITQWPHAYNAPQHIKHGRCTDFAMDDESVQIVSEAWRNAPPWTAGWPENDDNVHMTSHSMKGPGGGPYGMVKAAYREAHSGTTAAPPTVASLLSNVF